MFDVAKKTPAELESLLLKVKDSTSVRVARAEASVSRVRASADEEMRTISRFADHLESLRKERARFQTFEDWFNKAMTPAVEADQIHACASFLAYNLSTPPQVFSQILAMEFCKEHREQIIAEARASTLGNSERSLEKFIAENEEVLKRHGCI